MGKQSQLLLQPTKAEFGWQVGVTFDNKIVSFNINSINVCGLWFKSSQFSVVFLFLRIDNFYCSFFFDKLIFIL